MGLEVCSYVHRTMISQSRDTQFVGKSSWYFLVPLGLLALCFSTLPLQAGTVTLSGTEWTLSVALIGTEDGTETYRVTLEGDTANYTDTGAFISTVAIKISDSIIGDMVLTSAPEGTTLDNWTYVPGGMNGKGCSEKGQSWGCFDFTEYELVFGADIGGVVAWELRVDIPEGTLGSELEFKVHYLNSDGTKNGTHGATVPVSEPSTLILLLSGTGLLAGAARFRKKT